MGTRTLRPPPRKCSTVYQRELLTCASSALMGTNAYAINAEIKPLRSWIFSLNLFLDTENETPAQVFCHLFVSSKWFITQTTWRLKTGLVIKNHFSKKKNSIQKHANHLATLRDRSPLLFQSFLLPIDEEHYWPILHAALKESEASTYLECQHSCLLVQKIWGKWINYVLITN